MASPRPATWSVSACLRYRGGLEIRAAAENVVLPWWGHGGERLSFLLRLRRRLRLAVTSQCARAPAPASADPESKEKKKKPRALKLLRFLRSRLARAPSALRRKKPPPPRAEDEDDRGDPRAQPVPCFLVRRIYIQCLQLLAHLLYPVEFLGVLTVRFLFLLALPVHALAADSSPDAAGEDEDDGDGAVLRRRARRSRRGAPPRGSTLLCSSTEQEF